MSDNLKIWEQVCRVPPDQLKGFKRAGGFTGTAIKPMWSIHKMTEVFGPVGTGWHIDTPAFEFVDGYNSEKLVFCTVTVHAGGKGFVGVGGDKIVKHIPANTQYNRPERWENDDEACKKAYTDALTNALKLLGVGADIHMGLWDGNKYVDEAAHEKPAVMPAVNGTHGASKAANRDTYTKMVQAIHNTATTKALTDWYKANVTEIDALPADWIDQLRVEYSDRMSELKKVLA